VVQVKVTEEEKPEKKTKEEAQRGHEEKTEETGEPEQREKKEIPLQEMKKPELLEKARELQKSVEENFDLYMRSQAEIDNLKKRFQKEKEEWIKFSNESLIKQLLAVIDNLEKAISASQDENSLHSVREGVELTLKGLMDSLEKSGLEQVEAKGKSFDPNFHQAVSEQDDSSAKPGTVLQELQKGYILNQRLIRPAMVVVNKNRAENDNDHDSTLKKQEKT
jgi:molecular chaperone GrpE